MAERLRAKRRGFTYPVGADVARIAEVGGLKQLPKAEAQAIWGRMKRVAIGEFCDDMPPIPAALYLSRGDIERVTVDDDVSARARKKAG